MKIQPVILAGGNGCRVWPLSQKINPKQFIKYFDNLSSFQNTVLRNAHLGIPLIVANIVHKKIILEQLDEINSSSKIIFEQDQKNTAPCAIIASYYAKAQGFDAIALIPSDHYIENQKSYKKALIKSAKATEKYKFSVIGISPNCHNSNFGYIKTNHYEETDLYLASEFIEKPSKEIIKSFDMSQYFWNSGIYFFDINYVLELAGQFIPDITAALSKAFPDNLSLENIVELERSLYRNLPSISFDDAISVNLNSMALVKAHFKWSDLGSWEAIWNLDQRNDDQNNIQGQVITRNVTNSYISSDAKQTVVINLKDTIVVLKNGQLLITNKDGTGLIKEMLTELEEA